MGATHSPLPRVQIPGSRRFGGSAESVAPRAPARLSQAWRRLRCLRRGLTASSTPSDARLRRCIVVVVAATS
eukprot:560224-Pleurochrysis_carterae.AAC.4